MDKHGRLKAARRAAGLNQYELAKAAKVDQAQVSRMERGEKWASLDTLKLIAKAVGLPLRELYDDPDAFSPESAPALPDTAEDIAANRYLPKGLRDFAQEPSTGALDVDGPEWQALASIKLPVPINVHGYTTLLLAIRSVTRT